MIWQTVRGHHELVERFRRAIARGRLSHAYLFAGPAGVGKKRFAQTLANCLFCERHVDAELDACGECSGCRMFQAGTHPDYIAIGCPEGKSELPIEAFVGAREKRGREGLCYELAHRPIAGSRKIAVIDDANLMNDSSANALLKTLEEPPAGALLILIAENIEGILPTIRSRCQPITFNPLSDGDVAELLVAQEIVSDSSEASQIARLSDGSLAVAAQLVDPALRRLRETLYDSLSQPNFEAAALAKRMIEGLEEIGGDLQNQRASAGWIVRFTLEFYRRALLDVARSGGESVSGGIPQVGRYVARLGAAPGVVDRLQDLFDRAELTEGHLAARLSVPLSLETLFSELARIERASAVRA